jgi:hypothetical protein
MGCILLNFNIWLLYGEEVRQKFVDSVRGSKLENLPYFDIVHTEEGQAEAKVRSVVVYWIDTILKEDPECKEPSAIRDLMELVKNKLLVTNLPTRKRNLKATESSTPPPPSNGAHHAPVVISSPPPNTVHHAPIGDGAQASIPPPSIVINASGGEEENPSDTPDEQMDDTESNGDPEKLAWRATAAEFLKALDDILGRVEDDPNYLLRKPDAAIETIKIPEITPKDPTWLSAADAKVTRKNTEDVSDPMAIYADYANLGGYDS